MGILNNAIQYVNDRHRTGLEGFLTKYEEFYPYLPRPASVLTSGKAPQRRCSDRGEQIHQSKLESLRNEMGG